MQHEQSLADAFNGYMRETAKRLGRRVHSFSLDGQDRDAGADYLLTDANRFALVEFKFSEGSLVSEKHKPRRLSLCRGLEERADMRALHDLCHFIAWTSGQSLAVQINIYRHEICNRSVFGPTCGLNEGSPSATGRAGAGAFATEFLTTINSRSLALQEFESYLAWLLTDTSASTNSTLELLTRNPAVNDLAMIRFRSIAEAQSWLRENFPPAPARRRRRHGI